MKWLRVEKSKRIKNEKERIQKNYFSFFFCSLSLSLSLLSSLFRANRRLAHALPWSLHCHRRELVGGEGSKRSNGSGGQEDEDNGMRHRRRRCRRRCSIITIGVDSMPAPRLPALLPSRSLRLAGNDIITSSLCHVCIHVDRSSDAEATARLQFDSSGISVSGFALNVVVVVVVVVVDLDLDLDLNNNLLRLSPAADAPPSGRGPRLVAPRRG